MGGHHALADAGARDCTRAGQDRDRLPGSPDELSRTRRADRPRGGRPRRRGPPPARPRRDAAPERARPRRHLLRTLAHRRHSRSGAAGAPRRRGRLFRQACRCGGLFRARSPARLRLSPDGRRHRAPIAIAAPDLHRRRAVARTGLACGHGSSRRRRGRRNRRPGAARRRRRADALVGRNHRGPQAHSAHPQRLCLQLPAMRTHCGLRRGDGLPRRAADVAQLHARLPRRARRARGGRHGGDRARRERRDGLPPDRARARDGDLGSHAAGGELARRRRAGTARSEFARRVHERRRQARAGAARARRAALELHLSGKLRDRRRAHQHDPPRRSRGNPHDKLRPPGVAGRRDQGDRRTGARAARRRGRRAGLPRPLHHSRLLPRADGDSGRVHGGRLLPHGRRRA